MSTGAGPEDHREAQIFRAELRREMIARRMALPAETHTRLSADIVRHLLLHFPQLGGLTVGFCWPVQNEPDLRPAIEAWMNAGNNGFRAALPVVVKPGRPLAFRHWWPTQALVPDRYGIPSPTDGDFVTPQALLLPVNAFDADGYRLGYGGGFFDRTLEALQPPPLALGVGFAFQRIASIRPQAHDLPLDAVITEAGVFPTPR